MKVIEIIAKDLSDLQQQLDGRVVDGKTLKTAGAEVIEISRSASEQIFQLLWRPEVMFVLMLVAIYGIIGELSTSRRNPAGRGGYDRAGSCALHGSNSSHQCDRTDFDRTRFYAVRA